MNKFFLTSLNIGVILLLLACSSEPTMDKNDRVLEILSHMETAIEAKGLDEFMSHVDDGFTLTSRGYNKKDAERMLRIRLMRNSSVHVHQSVKSMQWLDEGDEQVSVELVAAMAGTAFSLSDMPSFRGDMAKFKITMQLIEGEYLITETTWERALPTDFIF